MINSNFPTHPAAFIFLNNDISDSTKATVQLQLYITETISLAEFNARILDPNYIANTKKLNARILVVDNPMDYTNRNLFDIVLYYKFGLVAIEKNNVGPHGASWPLGYLTLAKLIIYKDTGPFPLTCHPECRKLNRCCFL